MQTKLTLRLDRTLIERAKAHAARSGSSLSQMVAGFFAMLEAPEPDEDDLPPTVRALFGALAGSDVGEEDYRRYLAAKHG